MHIIRDFFYIYRRNVREIAKARWTLKTSRKHRQWVVSNTKRWSTIRPWAAVQTLQWPWSYRNNRPKKLPKEYDETIMQRVKYLNWILTILNRWHFVFSIQFSLNYYFFLQFNSIAISIKMIRESKTKIVPRKHYSEWLRIDTSSDLG